MRSLIEKYSPFGRSQCAKQTREWTKERQSPITPPFAPFPPLRSLSLHPLLPLFAAVLTTVTAALITPL